MSGGKEPESGPELWHDCPSQTQEHKSLFSIPTLSSGILGRQIYLPPGAVCPEIRLNWWREQPRGTFVPLRNAFSTPLISLDSRLLPSALPSVRAQPPLSYLFLARLLAELGALHDIIHFPPRSDQIAEQLLARLSEWKFSHSPGLSFLPSSLLLS